MSTCINCQTPMKKTHISYKGVTLEAQQCPKCKEKIFTEKLAMKAIHKLEAEQLKKEYLKTPIKIGNSIGITFPKEMTDAFELGKPNKKLKLHHNLEKRQITITTS